jgi:hypothetical protein
MPVAISGKKVGTSRQSAAIFSTAMLTKIEDGLLCRAGCHGMIL